MTFRISKKWTGLILLSPVIFSFCLFSAYPFFNGLSLAFYKYNIFEQTFIGFENFKKLFSDKYFWIALKNTLKFVIILVPIMVFVPLIISLFAIELPKKLGSFYRFAFYIPNVTAGVIITAVWRWFLHPNGLINGLLNKEILWLGGNPQAFWSIIMVMATTGLGVQLVLYMAALAAVDQSLIEAALLEGAEWRHRVWYIYIPSIFPVVIFMLITRTGGLFQIYQYPLLMTGGGPNYGTSTICLQIYQHGFQYGNMGYASAIAMILLLIVLTTVIIQKYIGKRIENN